MSQTLRFLSLSVCFYLFFTTIAMAEEQAPAEVAIGERLFLETRFAQAYATSPGKPDPALAYSVIATGKLPGPFAGQTMNCRNCHMVDEHADKENAGMRSYTDFAEMTPIPDRKDGKATTGRNSMSLVSIMTSRKIGDLFHFDGEFNSMEDLVRATLTGRNYGWLTREHAAAVAHIAKVIRSDDGKGTLAKESGGSYKKVLAGKDKSLPAAFVLPEKYRIDVDTSTDAEVLDAVARLITAYIADLNFAKDANGVYNTSPYDKFLELNKLPRKPLENESPSEYVTRLTDAIAKIQAPRYVITNEKGFKTHARAFKFGAEELRGLKLFLTKGSVSNSGGNCASCHTPPDFSDFGFHNTGISQQHYDRTHGSGAFNKLVIPGLAERNSDHNAFLPATGKHPEASERFRSMVSKKAPEKADLGTWNIFANPDFPAPQTKLSAIFCRQAKLKESACSEDKLLPLTIATFKTPILRDLGHSQPYMHTGEMADLLSVVKHYMTDSALARAGKLRNAAPELSDVYLLQDDLKALEAFLHSLNEDYE